MDGQTLNESTVFDSKIDGTMGMLSTYRYAATNTTFKGPSYLGKILARFMEIMGIEMAKYNKLYFVFVILTDGNIHDMDEVKRLMIKMSYLPVSLIIVGIGSEDFEDMNSLDADTKVLTDSDGRQAARDIC